MKAIKLMNTHRVQRMADLVARARRLHHYRISLNNDDRYESYGERYMRAADLQSKIEASLGLLMVCYSEIIELDAEVEA